MREHLRLLSKTLRECGELTLAARVEDVISASDGELDLFLRSNELWGGASSFADQAGIGKNQGRECRRKIEQALIQLGKEQSRAEIVNRRTSMWVSVFEDWEKAGV